MNKITIKKVYTLEFNNYIQKTIWDIFFEDIEDEYFGVILNLNNSNKCGLVFQRDHRLGGFFDLKTKDAMVFENTTINGIEKGNLCLFSAQALDNVAKYINKIFMLMQANPQSEQCDVIWDNFLNSTSHEIIEFVTINAAKFEYIRNIVMMSYISKGSIYSNLVRVIANKEYSIKCNYINNIGYYRNLIANYDKCVSEMKCNKMIDISSIKMYFEMFYRKYLDEDAITELQLIGVLANHYNNVVIPEKADYSIYK